MNKDLAHQYDNLAKDFSNVNQKWNKDSRRALHKMLPKSLEGKSVLDLGCGNGAETQKYVDLGAVSVLGVDASQEMLKEAREKTKGITFQYGLFDSIPAEDGVFDYVFSRYAFQTAENLESIWNEVNRVLKSGGIFMFVVTHPIRQFKEKKKVGKDYFKQEIVESVCFDGALTFKEPSHTLQEYFSQFMLENFTLEEYEEQFDIDAEKTGDIYPGFLLLKWKKK